MIQKQVMSVWIFGLSFYPALTGACNAPQDALPAVDGHIDISTRDGGERDDATGDSATMSCHPMTALSFSTDFEDATGIPPDAHEQIIVSNLVPSVPPMEVPNPTVLTIYYEDGTAADRYARLESDPLDPNNRVLHFEVHDAVIQTSYHDHKKARIQSNVDLTTIGGLGCLFSSVRLYVPSEWALMASYPPDGDPWWLTVTIQELWIGAAWDGDPDPARISLYVSVDSEGQMRIGAHAQTMPARQEIWTAPFSDYVLPYDTWLTLRVGYQMGDDVGGRFAVTVQAQDEDSPTTVVDVHDWTYSPSAIDPVKLTHWNPIKLYTSDNVIDHLRAEGAGASLFWDDMKVGVGWSDSLPPLH